ncbi:MAG: hypothetical protein R2857_02420 [Vampirovibrionales bacterium]
MEPPNRHYYYPDAPPMYEAEEMGSGNVACDISRPHAPTTSAGGMLKTQKSAAAKPEALRRNGPGLTKVAGVREEAEAVIKRSSGVSRPTGRTCSGDEVVYFVTPTGEITEAIMNAFAKAFEQWDNQAIWGGSFVVKDEVAKNSPQTPKISP